MAVKRIEILGVPVDVCPPEKLESEILEIMAKPGTKQIVFLNIWEMIKASKKGSKAGAELNECLKNADLILPVSKSILKAAKRMKLEVPERYNPFHTTIRILSILDHNYRSLYLLGDKQKALQAAESNLRDTFPGIQIVGRYLGFFGKKMEENVVQAIYKSSPSLVLLGDGIKEKNLWPYNRKEKFSSSMFLYYKDAIGIFAERKRRVDDNTFEKGREIYGEVLRNPLKIFLIFPYIGFRLRLFWNRIFRKKTED